VLAAAVTYVPYPSWLNTGDNTWQITAATFVGLIIFAQLGPTLVLPMVGGLLADKFDRKRLLRRIGSVDAATMRKIDEALMISLGLVTL